jgi:hypothetical protein
MTENSQAIHRRNLIDFRAAEWCNFFTRTAATSALAKASDESKSNRQAVARDVARK